MQKEPTPFEVMDSDPEYQRLREIAVEKWEAFKVVDNRKDFTPEGDAAFNALCDAWSGANKALQDWVSEWCDRNLDRRGRWRSW